MLDSSTWGAESRRGDDTSGKVDAEVSKTDGARTVCRRSTERRDEVQRREPEGWHGARGQTDGPALPAGPIDALGDRHQHAFAPRVQEGGAHASPARVAPDVEREPERF